MPTYNFRDTNSGEEIEISMRISELDQYKLDNPHMVQFLTRAPSIGDPVRLGVTKLDNGFREVLSKVAEKTPGGGRLKDHIR